MLPLTVAASVLYYILSFILHCLVGNPRGLFLILPGMVIGTLYNLVIVYILERIAHQQLVLPARIRFVHTGAGFSLHE